MDGEGKRLLLCCSGGQAKIVDARNGDTLCTLRDEPVRKQKSGFFLQEGDGMISKDGMRAVIVYPDPDALNFDLYSKARPEQWWGVAWLPECWMALAFGLLLLWSLRRDFKTLRAAKPPERQLTQSRQGAKNGNGIHHGGTETTENGSF